MQVVSFFDLGASDGEVKRAQKLLPANLVVRFSSKFSVQTMLSVDNGEARSILAAHYIASANTGSTAGNQLRREEPFAPE